MRTCSSRYYYYARRRWNYPDGADVPLSSRLWKAGMDRIYRPVYNNLMRQSSCAQSYETILRWDFEYIAPCHGEPVSEGGRRVLAEHLELDAPL